MNLTDQYISENGYNYFGNAAEDTLVFFVHDEDAPNVALTSDNDDDSDTSDDNTESGFDGSNSSETMAVNKETEAQIYDAKNGGRSTDFDLEDDTINADKSNASDAMSVPDANTYDDEFSQMMPKMTPADSKQTETNQADNNTGLRK